MRIIPRLSFNGKNYQYTENTPYVVDMVDFIQEKGPSDDFYAGQLVCVDKNNKIIPWEMKNYEKSMDNITT